MAYFVFLVMMISLSIWSFYITRKEKRSFRSWGSEKLLQLRLKRGWFHASEDSNTFLQQQALRNEEPFVFPTPLKILAIVEQKTIAGIECVILHEREISSKKQILYLHGGAYVEHPIIPHWLFLDRINNVVKGTIVVPIYPKAPVHTVLESFDRMVAIYLSLLEKSDPSQIILMGDSAGGGFALAVAQQLLLQGTVLPKEIILISPWLDITLKNAAIDAIESKDPMLSRQHLKVMGKAWVGEIDPTDWRVSPINGPLKGLGQLSVFIGTHEIFLPDVYKLKMLCRRLGVGIQVFAYPKMNHDFPLFPIPEARKAQREIVEIINRA